MARKSKYIKTEDACIADAISSAFSQLEDLASECREVVDNAPENLRDSQRITTLGEAADALESLSEPSVPDGLDDVRCQWQENIHPRASRAQRRDNATAALSAVYSALEDHIAELDERIESGKTEDGTTDLTQDQRDELESQKSDAEELMGEVERARDEADGVEFPGMFG